MRISDEWAECCLAIERVEFKVEIEVELATEVGTQLAQLSLVYGQCLSWAL